MDSLYEYFMVDLCMVIFCTKGTCNFSDESTCFEMLKIGHMNISNTTLCEIFLKVGEIASFLY